MWKPETDDSYLFNGWLNNGRLCGINTYMEDDKVTILRYDELDFDSGKLLSSVDLGPGDWLRHISVNVPIFLTQTVYSASVPMRRTGRA